MCTTWILEAHSPCSGDRAHLASFAELATAVVLDVLVGQGDLSAAVSVDYWQYKHRCDVATHKTVFDGLPGAELV
jgi:hypothetical protein